MKRLLSSATMMCRYASLMSMLHMYMFCKIMPFQVATPVILNLLSTSDGFIFLRLYIERHFVAWCIANTGCTYSFSEGGVSALLTNLVHCTSFVSLTCSTWKASAFSFSRLHLLKPPWNGSLPSFHSKRKPLLWTLRKKGSPVTE